MTTTDPAQPHCPGAHEAPPSIPATLDDLSDAELLALAGSGVRDAFSSLHQRYSRFLNNMALRMLGDTEDTEEVLQEAFLYAWNRAASYDPSRSAVSTWLWQITRSRCLDLLRRRQRIGRTLSAVERESPASHCEPAGFDQVVRQERAGRLHQAMTRLPEPQRKVHELSYFGGLSQRKIAARFDIPVGTVKSRFVLAMKKLRKDLAAQDVIGSGSAA